MFPSSVADPTALNVSFRPHAGASGQKAYTNWGLHKKSHCVSGQVQCSRKGAIRQRSIEAGYPHVLLQVECASGHLGCVVVDLDIHVCHEQDGGAGGIEARATAS